MQRILNGKTANRMVCFTFAAKSFRLNKRNIYGS